MKTKTPKKKPVKTAKIPPPPPGWEIVGKDDPRLDCLPKNTLVFYADTWASSCLPDGINVSERNRTSWPYALPIAQPAQSPTPMIRLRLPSDKPTREDGDKDGYVLVFWDNGQTTLRLWSIRFESAIIAWLPGRLPDGILPREPSQEERLRTEFEEKFNSKYPDGSYKEAAWQGFLAAKKGGEQ